MNLEFTAEEKKEYFEKREQEAELVNNFYKDASKAKTEKEMIESFAENAVELYKLNGGIL